MAAPGGCAPRAQSTRGVPLPLPQAAAAARNGSKPSGGPDSQPAAQLPPHKGAAARIEESLGVRAAAGACSLQHTARPRRSSDGSCCPVESYSVSPYPAQQPDFVRFESCQLDDLEVGRVLGTGSFGRVSLARHRSTGLVCAVKALSKAHIVKSQQARAGCCCWVAGRCVGAAAPVRPSCQCAARREASRHWQAEQRLQPPHTHPTASHATAHPPTPCAPHRSRTCAASATSCGRWTTRPWCACTAAARTPTVSISCWSTCQVSGAKGGGWVVGVGFGVMWRSWSQRSVAAGPERAATPAAYSPPVVRSRRRRVLWAPQGGGQAERGGGAGVRGRGAAHV